MFSQNWQGQSSTTHFFILFLKILSEFTDFMSFGIRFHSFHCKCVSMILFRTMWNGTA